MKQLFRHYCDSFRLDSTPDGREFLTLTATLREEPAIRALAAYRHHMSVSRLQHVTSVAYLSYLLCKKRGLCAEEHPV